MDKVVLFDNKQGEYESRDIIVAFNVDCDTH